MTSAAIWCITIFFILGVYVVAQLWWTRQHARNLAKHEEEMKRIYERYR